MLPLMQDQQVVQAFLPNTPQKAFADGVGAFRMNRRFEDLDCARFRYTSKTRPELAIVITDQVLRGLSIRGGFLQLLRHASIGRRSCDAHMDHLPRFQFDYKECKDGRKKRSVTCKKSQAQICAA